MEKKVIKISFFKKLWYSITKFEQYPNMALEGLWRAIKYSIILTAIFTVFMMIASLLEMKSLVNDLSQYVQNNIPDFSYEQGKLSMKMEESIIIEDAKQIGLDRIVINTLAETEEQKEQIEKENLKEGITLFFLKDQIILKTKLENEQILRQPYTYSELIRDFSGEEISQFNKSEFTQYLISEKMISFYAKYGLSMFAYFLILNVIVALLDALEIAILGFITTAFARIRMKFTAIYNMAIYSMTLPVFLNILYIVINYFTDFTIKYFQVAYMAIAYIYLAAAIFILKDDFIQKMQEVEKIRQEQLRVKDEIKEEQEKKDDEEEENKEDKEDKKDDDKGDEPQGSEA